MSLSSIKLDQHPCSLGRKYLHSEPHWLHFCVGTRHSGMQALQTRALHFEGRPRRAVKLTDRGVLSGISTSLPACRPYATSQCRPRRPSR